MTSWARWCKTMRSLFSFLFLLCAVTETLGSDRADSRIYSINLCLRPTAFFHGFAFYADRDGNVFVQDYINDASKFKERRIVLRKQPEIFQRLLRITNLKALLQKPSGRKVGVFDEVLSELEIILENGVRISASKWDNEKSKVLDPILTAIQRVGSVKLKEPTVEIIEEADLSDLNALHYKFEKP